jgi:plastocyanin
VTATSTPALSGSPVSFATTIVTAPLAFADTVGDLGDAFNPPTFNIGTGGTITWVWNSGGITHNVTFEEAALGSGSGNKNSGTFLKDLTGIAPGTYHFRCTIHSTNFSTGMVGSFTVQ